MCHFRQKSRIEKVFLQRKAEHPSHADGHIAVAGKIKIDLQTVADPAQPGEAGVRERGREDRVGCDGGCVGQQQLFPEPHEKAPDPGRGLFGRADALVDLCRDITPADDGTCDQLWEKRNVQQQLQKAPAVFLRLPVDVDGIAEPLKGVEGNADRQDQSHRLQRQAEEGVGVADQEIGVLENAEDAEIQHDVQRDQWL